MQFLAAFLSLLSFSSICAASSLEVRNPGRLTNLFKSPPPAQDVIYGYGLVKPGKQKGYLDEADIPCITQNMKYHHYSFVTVYLNSFVKAALDWQAKTVPGARLMSVEIANMDGSVFAPDKEMSPYTVILVTFIRVLNEADDQSTQQSVQWKFELTPGSKPTAEFFQREPSKFGQVKARSFKWDEQAGSLLTLAVARKNDLVMHTAQNPASTKKEEDKTDAEKIQDQNNQMYNATVVEIGRFDVSSTTYAKAVLWGFGYTRHTGNDKEVQYDLYHQQWRSEALRKKGVSYAKPICFTGKAAADVRSSLSSTGPGPREMPQTTATRATAAKQETEREKLFAKQEKQFLANWVFLYKPQQQNNPSLPPAAAI